ncbi:MAG: alpha/beta fold hydrolase [Phycisphaeraceae bacterium]|nr:alpha/beta fold hydrolase [Phycisphaeraceae bacterium]
MNTRTMVGRVSQPAIQLAVAAVALPLFSAFAAAAGICGETPPPTIPAASVQPPEAARPRATATDLARAYIELERAFFAAPVERELCREVNIAFDEASLLFFSGDFARVVEIVNAQTARIMETGGLKPHVLRGPREEGALEAGPLRGSDQVALEIADFVAESETDGLLQKVQWPANSELVWRERRLLLSRVETRGTMESLLFSSRSLATELGGEYRRVIHGEHPYTRRRGDLWRPFFIDDQPAPMRLFCPENREPPAAGWPLVIALHGAGGNEHMFFAAYGVGRIKQLAQQHGFVVACPQNSPFSAQASIFDALVDSIALDYPIDRSRIYLVGHSMGAAVALAWSKGRHDKVAASALIAGAGRLSPRDTLPPTLVIAPELDGLIAAKSIIDNAERAAAAGVKVEVREIKDYGHTLVVGHVLPEVIEWLLNHTREGDAPAPPAPPASPRTAKQGAAP